MASSSTIVRPCRINKKAIRSRTSWIWSISSYNSARNCEFSRYTNRDYTRRVLKYHCKTARYFSTLVTSPSRCSCQCPGEHYEQFFGSFPIGLQIEDIGEKRSQQLSFLFFFLLLFFFTFAKLQNLFLKKIIVILSEEFPSIRCVMAFYKWRKSMIIRRVF